MADPRAFISFDFDHNLTSTPRPWDRRSTETTKAYAAFLAYVALGARRSVREAARQSHQNHIKTTSTGETSSVEHTTVRTWLGWSAKYAWVSRSLARDEWIARTSGSACNNEICLPSPLPDATKDGHQLAGPVTAAGAKVPIAIIVIFLFPNPRADRVPKPTARLRQ